MGRFFTKHATGLRYFSLAAMMIIPFLLYFVAKSGGEVAVIGLLGLMGAVMLLTMKVG